MEYKAGDNVRLAGGRMARIMRVFAGDLYDVRFHDGDQERIDVLREDIICHVRRAAIWVDAPDEPQADGL